ncbi:MAG: hypothetical protein WAR79_18785 [Melioribacteraceae bacterium]
MLLANLKKNKPKLEKFSHIFSGIIVLFSAFDKYESGNYSFILFALAGIIFILIAIFHAKISQKFVWVDNVFIFLEGTISFIIALDYFFLGKKALPFAYIFAGLLQFTVGYFKLKKKSIFNKADNTIKN